MKGLLVFDERSDIAFYSLDKELEKYIICRIRHLEEAAGAQTDDAGSAYSDMRDVLGAFFLPFNTSFGVLNNLKKPILAITTEDGFLIVFRKFGENVYIALGDGQETEETLTRKLFVFNRIVGFLYGPVESRLNCPDMSERKVVWEKLSCLLKSYERLYHSDQVFLLEAIEHVQFGQLQAAQEVVVKLAKECLDPSNNGGLPNVQHAMLLVNTKLLTICGKSPQIPTSDILLMTLFISQHFHQPPPQAEEGVEEEEEQEEEDDKGSSVSSSPDQTFPEEMNLNTPGANEAVGEEEGDGQELFQTPRSTPAGTRRPSEIPDMPEFDLDDPQFATPRETLVTDITDGELQFKTPGPIEEDTPSMSVRDTVGSNRGLPAKLKALMIGGFGKRPLPDAEGVPSSPPNKAKFVEHMAFLQPNQGIYIPHTLHCLEVYSGIVLILITELSGTYLAGTICQTLQNLSNVLNSSRNSLSGGQSTFDILEDALRRISDLVRREVQATASNALNQCNKKVQNVWINLKSAGFRSFLERVQIPTEDLRYARIEACGRDLMDKLVKLFEKLYFTPRQREYDTNHVVSRLMKNFANLKRDYGEFLALKGVLNIPMVSFSQSFQGMVHFVLIDRSFDEMTTPSLSSTENHVGIPYVEKLAQKKGECAGALLHRKIWSMVQRAQKFLALGYTSQTWLDEDFLYSYYLWINIPNNALGTPVRFVSPTNVKASETSPPGVIGTHFYRDLYHSDTRSQGYVYELYCMHQSTVPIKTASNQCKILAEQLWPSSKEAIAPFSLIN